MDEQQFTEAVRQYQRLLAHIAYAKLGNEQDCADAVQQALLNAWRKRKQLRNENLVKAWLTRILVNECNNILRKRQGVSWTMLSADIPASSAPDSLPIRDALGRLPDKLRLPIVLYYLDGFTVAEIAQTMRIPTGTVKSRLLKARSVLAKELGDPWEA